MLEDEEEGIREPEEGGGRIEPEEGGGRRIPGNVDLKVFRKLKSRQNLLYLVCFAPMTVWVSQDGNSFRPFVIFFIAVEILLSFTFFALPSFTWV